MCLLSFSRAVKAGLELPSNFREEFLSTEVTTIFSRLKVCFHVASTISPLAILVPTQWSNYQIGREHLFMVRFILYPFPILIIKKQKILYALGNERPAALLEVERALCNCIMKIMAGSDAETQLKLFLEEYDAMKLAWEANGMDLSLDFFDNGEAICSQGISLALMYCCQPFLDFPPNLRLNRHKYQLALHHPPSPLNQLLCRLSSLTLCPHHLPR